MSAFEESTADIRKNILGFGWNPDDEDGYESGNAGPRPVLAFIDARVTSEFLAGGTFDVSALLGLLDLKVAAIGASRVVLDGIDVLLDFLEDPADRKREILRIHEWLSENNLTGIITAKMDGQWGADAAMHYEFMAYMADTVVLMNHEIMGSSSTRHLRILKYRGSDHLTGEFPVMIGPQGLIVGGITEPRLDHPASADRVTTGVAGLDSMLGGGYHRGSGILVSGAPGTAKSSLAGAFAAANCRAGDQVLYISFDESPLQIERNLASIGVDLGDHIESGRLKMASFRIGNMNSEEHLVRIQELIEQYNPTAVIIDPISALSKLMGTILASGISQRLLDYAKSRAITILFTSVMEQAEMGAGGYARSISPRSPTPGFNFLSTSLPASAIVPSRSSSSRGTAHSNQVREMILSDAGIEFADPYTASGAVLMGTARLEKEQEERASEATRISTVQALRRTLDDDAARLSAERAALERQCAAVAARQDSLNAKEQARVMGRTADREDLQRSRNSATDHTLKPDETGDAPEFPAH